MYLWILIPGLQGNLRGGAALRRGGLRRSLDRMNAPPPNIDALQAFAARLERVDAVSPPDAPGATIVMALGRGSSGQTVTFAGCDLDPLNAFAASVGEAVEWSAQNHRRNVLPDADPALPRIGDFDELIDEAGDGWFAMEGIAGTAPGRVPTALVIAAGRLHMPLSHGCAAGATAETALSAALCEWVERDAALRWWRGEQPPASVGEPAAAAAADWLAVARRGRSSRSTVLLDIGAGSAVPVIVAASFDPDGSGAAFGMKAHADPATAARGALREMAQMEFGLRLAQVKRERQGQTALTPGDVAALRRAARTRHSALVTPIPRPARPHEAIGPGAADIASRLAGSGHRIWACRLDDEPGAPVVRTLVSGLRAPFRAANAASGSVDLY